MTDHGHARLARVAFMSCLVGAALCADAAPAFSNGAPYVPFPQSPPGATALQSINAVNGRNHLQPIGQGQAASGVAVSQGSVGTLSRSWPRGAGSAPPEPASPATAEARRIAAAAAFQPANDSGSSPVIARAGGPPGAGASAMLFVVGAALLVVAAASSLLVRGRGA